MPIRIGLLIDSIIPVQLIVIGIQAYPGQGVLSGQLQGGILPAVGIAHLHHEGGPAIAVIQIGVRRIIRLVIPEVPLHRNGGARILGIGNGHFHRPGNGASGGGGLNDLGRQLPDGQSIYLGTILAGVLGHRHDIEGCVGFHLIQRDQMAAARCIFKGLANGTCQVHRAALNGLHRSLGIRLAGINTIDGGVGQQRAYIDLIGILHLQLGDGHIVLIHILIIVCGELVERIAVGIRAIRQQLVIIDGLTLIEGNNDVADPAVCVGVVEPHHLFGHIGDGAAGLTAYAEPDVIPTMLIEVPHTGSVGVGVGLQIFIGIVSELLGALVQVVPGGGADGVIHLDHAALSGRHHSDLGREHSLIAAQVAHIPILRRARAVVLHPAQLQRVLEVFVQIDIVLGLHYHDVQLVALLHILSFLGVRIDPNDHGEGVILLISAGPAGIEAIVPNSAAQQLTGELAVLVTDGTPIAHISQLRHGCGGRQVFDPSGITVVKHLGRQHQQVLVAIDQMGLVGGSIAACTQSCGDAVKPCGKALPVNIQSVVSGHGGSRDGFQLGGDLQRSMDLIGTHLHSRTLGIQIGLVDLDVDPLSVQSGLLLPVPCMGQEVSERVTDSIHCIINCGDRSGHFRMGILIVRHSLDGFLLGVIPSSRQLRLNGRQLTVLIQRVAGGQVTQFSQQGDGLSLDNKNSSLSVHIGIHTQQFGPDRIQIHHVVPGIYKALIGALCGAVGSARSLGFCDMVSVDNLVVHTDGAAHLGGLTVDIEGVQIDLDLMPVLVQANALVGSLIRDDVVEIILIICTLGVGIPHGGIGAGGLLTQNLVGTPDRPDILVGIGRGGRHRPRLLGHGVALVGGIITHPDLLHGSVLRPLYQHQLHPGRDRVVIALGILSSLAVLKAQVHIGDPVRRHALEAEISGGSDIGGFCLTHDLIHKVQGAAGHLRQPRILAGIKNIGTNHCPLGSKLLLGDPGGVQIGNGIVTLALHIAVAPVHPQVHIISVDPEDDTDGNGTLGVVLVGGNIDHKGVFQCVLIIGQGTVLHLSSLMEILRDPVQGRDGLLLIGGVHKGELFRLQVALGHHVAEAAGDGLVVGLGIVHKDLLSTDRVTAHHLEGGTQPVAALLVNGLDHGCTHLSGSQNIPGNTAGGGRGTHFTDGIRGEGVGRRVDEGITLIVKLGIDLPLIVLNGGGDPVGNMELVSAYLHDLLTALGQHHILRPQLQRLQHDPRQRGVGRQLELVSGVPLIDADLTPLVVAISIQGADMVIVIHPELLTHQDIAGSEAVAGLEAVVDGRIPDGGHGAEGAAGSDGLGLHGDFLSLLIQPEDGLIPDALVAVHIDFPPYGLGIHNLNRGGIGLDRVALAQTAPAIFAPCPYMLLSRDGQRMVGVGCDGYGILGILTAIEAHHIHGIVPQQLGIVIRVIAITVNGGLLRIGVGQLVVGIAAPSDNGTIGKQGQGVILSVGHTNDLLALGDTDLHGLHMIIVHVRRSVHIEGQSTQVGGVPSGITADRPVSGVFDGKACGHLGGSVIEGVLPVCRRIHNNGEVGGIHLAVHPAHFPPQGIGPQLDDDGRHIVGTAALRIDLAVQVEAPAPHGAVIADHADGVAPGALGQVNDLAHAGHLLRCTGMNAVGPVHTQLALGVGTPGVHTAALSEGHRVGNTGHHLYYPAVRACGGIAQSDHRGLAQPVRLHLVASEAPGEPQAQFAVGVAAPGIQPTLVRQGQGVILAGGDGNNVLIRLQTREVDFHRQQGVGLLGVNGMAQLAILVVTPGPDGAIAAQSQSVLLTGGDHGRHDIDRLLLGIIIGDHIHIVHNGLITGPKYDLGEAIAHTMDHKAVLVQQSFRIVNLLPHGAVFLGDKGLLRSVDQSIAGNIVLTSLQHLVIVPVGHIAVDIGELRRVPAPEVSKQVEAVTQDKVHHHILAHMDQNLVLAAGLTLFAHDDGRITEGIVLIEGNGIVPVIPGLGIVAHTIDLTGGVRNRAIRTAGADGAKNNVCILQIAHIHLGNSHPQIAGGRTQAQLAVPVVAPGIQLAIVVHRQVVVHTGADIHDVGQFIDDTRLGSLNGVVSQLPAKAAILIGTPGQHPGAVSQGNRVIAACTHLQHRSHLRIIQEYRSVHIALQGHSGADYAQFAIGITAGGIDIAVKHGEQAVIFTRRNGVDIDEGQLGRHIHLLCVVQAQLAPIVAAPRKDAAIAGQSQGVAVTSGDCHDLRTHRGQCGGSRSIQDLHKVGQFVHSGKPQLTVFIAACGPDITIRVHRQGVILTGRHIHEDNIGLLPNGHTVLAEFGMILPLVLAAAVLHPGLDLHRIVIAQDALAISGLIDLIAVGTQLTMLVETIGPDGAVSPERQGVTAAAGYLSHDQLVIGFLHDLAGGHQMSIIVGFHHRLQGLWPVALQNHHRYITVLIGHHGLLHLHGVTAMVTIPGIQPHHFALHLGGIQPTVVQQGGNFGDIKGCVGFEGGIVPVGDIVVPTIHTAAVQVCQTTVLRLHGEQDLSIGRIGSVPPVIVVDGDLAASVGVGGHHHILADNAVALPGEQGKLPAIQTFHLRDHNHGRIVDGGGHMMPVIIAGLRIVVQGQVIGVIKLGRVGNKQTEHIKVGIQVVGLALHQGQVAGGHHALGAVVEDILTHITIGRGYTIQLLGHGTGGVIQTVVSHKAAVGPGNPLGAVQLLMPGTVPDHVGGIGSHVGTHKAIVAHIVESVTLRGGVVVCDGHPQGTVAHQGGQIGIAAGTVGQLVSVVGALAPEHTVLIQVDALTVAAKNIDVVVIPGGIHPGAAGRAGQLGLTVLGLHIHIGVTLAHNGGAKTQLTPVVQAPGIGPVIPGPSVGAVQAGSDLRHRRGCGSTQIGRTLVSANHLHRRAGMILGIAGAQLTVDVGTHGPHISVHIQSQQVVGTRRDLGDGQGHLHIDLVALTVLILGNGGKAIDLLGSAPAHTPHFAAAEHIVGSNLVDSADTGGVQPHRCGSGVGIAPSGSSQDALAILVLHR